MALDVSKLKLNWTGEWMPKTSYTKGDLSSWTGKTYRCMRDTPVDFVIYNEGTMSSNHYTMEHPEVVKKSYRPDNRTYWSLHIRGAPDCALWEYHRQYEPGEFAKANGKTYQCISQTRHANTWVEETEYWTKVFESRKGRDGRHEVVAHGHAAPLGWRYNMGYNNTQHQMDDYYSIMNLCTDGTVMHVGGVDRNSKFGAGDSDSGNYSNGSHKYNGFTFVDWLNSSDNSSWNVNAFTTDEDSLNTPDGETPRCIQAVECYSTGLFLFNNGEVYAAGYNGQGQMGNWNTSDYNYPQRVTAKDETDWNGNPCKTFNQTKIVKVGGTSMGGGGGGHSMFGIGEDGSVWMWGHNNQGQLGFGNPHVQTSTDWSGTTAIGADGLDYTRTGGSANWPFAWYSANFNRPHRIPQEAFDGKRIVDMWGHGQDDGRFHALDEEGFLWAWGHNMNGELGIGQRNGTYYMYTPTRVGIDWNVHGGMKKLITRSWGWGQTFVLDGEGWIWGTGQDDNSYGTPGWGPIGYTSAHYWGSFKRLNFRPNGDVDDFWCGGDSNDGWFALRQKSTGACWELNGGYANGGRGHSVHNNNYWAGGTGINNVVGMIKGPQYIKWVTGPNNSDPGDASYTYSDPLYLDWNGDVYMGGRNEDGYASVWWNASSTQSGWNGHNWPATSEPSFIGINFENKRKVFYPSGTRIVNVQMFGQGHYPMAAYTDDRGKVMWAGYDYNNRSCHHYSWMQYSINDNHRDIYNMHSGPTD
jgi:alpha-tubulin suppressor-like RCC1 family protein